jgi:hypothetical protein
VLEGARLARLVEGEKGVRRAGVGSVHVSNDLRWPRRSGAHHANADLIAVDRLLAFGLFRPTRQKFADVRFQCNRRLGCKTDGGGDGKRDNRAVRYGVAQRRLEVGHKTSCHFVEPQARVL